MSILIGLLSCHAHRTRDELVEATWAPVARALGMTVLYMTGEGRFGCATYRDGNYLRIPCPDDYQSLPQKSAGFFKWALTQQWDRCLKADNDSLVIPARLAALAEEDGDYRGCEPGCKWRGYASGAGYLLSRRSVEILAEQMRERVGAEDLIAGRHLRRAGIRLIQDERVDPWGRRPPTPENDVMISHHLTEQQWLEAWGPFARMLDIQTATAAPKPEATSTGPAA